MISLLIILVLGLLSLTTNEQRSSTAFADTVDSRALSELAVDLVIAQIRKATEENSPDKKPTSNTNFAQHQTWASQPGMIRVFGTEEDGSGYRAKPIAAYKLYSDDRMVWKENTAGQDLPDELNEDRSDLNGWKNKPGLFTDMNEPGRVVLDASTGDSRLVFPIINPAASQQNSGGPGIAGFSYEIDTALGTATDSLPMPVRWIYVLKDGRLTAPTDSIEGVVEFTDSPVKPGPDNPIVGRIAFWTDDECCKVNINTASEGDYWDTPRTYTKTESTYANRLPARREYNRFPGHPAMTCLSPIYQAFDENLEMPADLSENDRRSRMEIYTSLSPHVGWGGTEGGTVDTSFSPTSPPAEVPAKRTRLYATVDELFFSPNRAPWLDTSLSGGTKVDFDNEDFQIGQAFLTAHSKAPELNLFNKPKISLWPQSRNKAERNAVDRLIAFCNRAGGRQWEFDRKSNYKSHKSVGSAMSTYGDWSGRNTAMLSAYLPYLSGKPVGGKRYEIPGFGSTMRSKYGTRKTFQIITSSFDLVHWSVNSYSTGLGKDYAAVPARAGIAGTSNPGLIGESSALGFRWRSEGVSAKGFGRFPTVTEAAIVFMAVDAERNPDGTFIDEDSNGFADKTTKFQAFWILEPFSPTVGPPAWTANVIYGLPSLNAGAHGIKNSSSSGSVNLNWTNNPQLKANYPSGWAGGGHSMPFVGMMSMFMQADQSGKTGLVRSIGNRKNSKTEYTFASAVVDVSAFNKGAEADEGIPFIYKGGEFVIETKLGYNGGVVQRLQMDFPEVKLSLPELYIPDAAQEEPFTSLNNRFRKDDTSGYITSGSIRETLIRPGDRVRSVMASSSPTSPSRGDLRFIAGLYSVPEEYFEPHPYYSIPDAPCAHGLQNSIWREKGSFGWVPLAIGGGKKGGSNSYGHPAFMRRFNSQEVSGSLLSNVSYPPLSWPSVSTGLNGALKNDGRPGDWDTGVGRIGDGPYINKPDEGNSMTGELSYMGFGNFSIEAGQSFSPNRQICSAVAFGSLPTGIDSVGVDLNSPKPVSKITEHVDSQEPWQTLLFCPNPPSRTTPALSEPNESDHRGFEHPRDHLYLENFWMPVVQPYAISEPAATAGKINMNYQMVPFTFIERATGIHCALKSTKLMAIPTQAVDLYKTNTKSDIEFRYNVNTESTLTGFRHRFDQHDIFRSPSEICEIFLVPEEIPGKSYHASAAPPPDDYGDMVDWWNGSLTVNDAFELTGDNLREAPYNQLYPRLTTRSNVYKVHYRVQVLSPGSRTLDKWDESLGSVTAEYRGSTLLERYLDPNENDNNIGSGGGIQVGVGAGDWWHGWDRYYRFRIIRRQRFAP